MKEHDLQESMDPRLVELLNQLRDTPERDADLVEQNRRKFLAELDSLPLPESRPSPWERLMSRLGILPEYRSHRDREGVTMHSKRTRLAITIAALLVVAVIVVFGSSAVTVLAAESAIPGDALYPVKTTVEQTRLSLTRDAAARAEMQLQFAERRLAEIESLIAEGRFQSIEAAALAFEAHINSALAEADTVAEADPALASRLMARISDSLSRYAGSLGEMLNDVPEPLRADMERTIRSAAGLGGNENLNVNESFTENVNDSIDANDNINDNVNESINDNYNANDNTDADYNENTETDYNDNTDAGYNENTDDDTDTGYNDNTDAGYNENTDDDTDTGYNDNTDAGYNENTDDDTDTGYNDNTDADDNDNNNDNGNENSD